MTTESVGVNGQPQPVVGADGTRQRRVVGVLAPAPSDSALRPSRVEVTTKAEFRLDQQRSAAFPRGGFDIADDDVLEIEYAEGQRLWVSAGEFFAKHAEKISRTGSGALELPLELPLAAGDSTRDAATRGVVSWALKSLKVLGVDLAALTARQIAEKIDDKTQYTGGHSNGGLLRLPFGDTFERPAPPTAASASAGRALVFVHGTFASTWTSFGGLWSEQRRDTLAALRNAYRGRAYTFEHPTLTVSPVLNAAELARALVEHLPRETEIDLLTHSRGGLIGELLCRAHARSTNGLFHANELVGQNSAEFEELSRALAALQKHDIKVRRLVRVGCPAFGTTLASERLHRWLSVMANIAGLALRGTPLSEFYETISDFLLAVAKEGTKPSALPGLAAMMPDAPLIRLINSPLTELDSDLMVIAGDIEPDAWWKKLLTFLADRFYVGDHDLIVNTPSMFGGAPRAARPDGRPRALLSEHRGPAVNHFNYFSNADSAGQLVRALTRKDDDLSGFQALKPARPPARAVYARGGRPMPLCFVLPGIMGSEIEVDGNRIWLDVKELFLGRFARLGFDLNGGVRVRAPSVVARFYEDLLQYLAESHRVVPLPYDWRRPIEDEADRLATRILEEINGPGQAGLPVRMLAHSMGGLVARALVAKHPEVWRRMTTHATSRLVMLGTPTAGSHAIAGLLLGNEGVFRALSILDVVTKREDLLRIIAGLPGVLSLLPDAASFYEIDTWKRYIEVAGRGEVPTKADLDRAKKFRELINGAPLDRDRMIYVAGRAEATPAELRIDPSTKKLELLATARGDGRVTWDSGIPSGIPVWYMNASHGDLAKEESSFEAIRELLEQGSTTRLATTPPVSRSQESALFPMPFPLEENFPDEHGLAVAALGGSPRTAGPRTSARPHTNVTMVHANLRFARFPVTVGHYVGDVITSAELELDASLGGRLTRAHQLGVYPGASETSEVFLRPEGASLRGAIVLGLGQVGELTAGSLARTVTRASLAYALTLLNEGSRAQSKGQTGPLRLGVSALLIGTGAGGMSIADSLYAILDGVRSANERLRSAEQPVQIGEIEFVELWEDRALSALEHLVRLEEHPELRRDFAIEPTLRSERSGRRRLQFDPDEAGWWQRLQILGDPSADAPDGALRFTAVTRRARAEMKLIATQRSLVDQFIAGAIGSTSYARETSRTLFELLFPNELKELAPDRRDIVLLLDEAAASYPWELLEDRRSGDEKPIAVQCGIVRQLLTKQPRQLINNATQNTALVIGDPRSSFVELHGAQLEAEAVWSALRAGHFQVDKNIRGDAVSIVRALFANDYRVLHLAGHGVYRYVPSAASQPQISVKAADGTFRTGALEFATGLRLAGEMLPLPPALANCTPCDCPHPEGTTGMVLGDGVFLTPSEVEQMRSVPELVFINCCFLGRTEASDPAIRPNRRDDYNRLAANIATQFIGMGVRAVVAAGWAVEDAAAQTFATTFYDQMLSGVNFGDAVKRARTVTHAAHRNSNTWGAYQCYGDPGYVLIRECADRTTGADCTFRSPSHAASELDNRLRSMRRDEDLSQHQAYLQRAREWLTTRGWLEDSQVASALAAALAEAGDSAAAAELFKRASKAKDGLIRLRDIEQYANLLARGDQKQDAQTWSNNIDEAVDLLRWSMHANGSTLDEWEGRTPERLCLLGSAYKRKAGLMLRAALATAPDAPDLQDVTKTLVLMRDAYRAAWQMDPNKPDTYAVTNYLTAATLAALATGQLTDLDQIKDECKALLPECRSALRAGAAAQPEFWSGAALHDCDVIEALVSGQTLDKEALSQKIEQLIQGYMDARHRARPRDFDSVLYQFDWLNEMARTFDRSKRHTGSFCDIVARLIRGLNTVG